MARQNRVGNYLMVTAVIVGIVLSFGIIRYYDTPSEQVLIVGVAMPISMEVGQQILNGAQLALDQRNGEVASLTVEIQPYDLGHTGSDTYNEQVLNSIEQFTDNSSVIAVIGAATSDSATTEIPRYGEASLALLSPSATWAGLTRSGYRPGEPGKYYPTGVRNFFRVIPGDHIQGVVAAKWLGDIGAKKVYVLKVADVIYSIGLTSIFAANAEQYGLEIVGDTEVNALQQSPQELDTLAQQVIATEPDAVYYPMPIGYDAEQLIFKLHEIQPDLTVLSSDGLANANLSELDNLALLAGTYATVTNIPPGDLESATSFVDAFEAAYDTAPMLYAMTAYDAMIAIMDSLEQAETPSRAGVLAALQSGIQFEGASGTWTFDENGDTSLAVVSVLQFENNAWQTVDIIR